jgi:hypothetical protein
MSLLRKISNKISYSIAKVLNDPEADAYGRQQEAQEAHDREVRQRQATDAAAATAAALAKTRSDQTAAKLEDRSQFRPGRAISNISNGILNMFFKFFMTVIMLYAGHLSANEAIGYNVPFRILSFIYGKLLFFYVIPRFLIRKYYYNISNINYAFLPVSTYVPATDAEKILLKPFCYKEDQHSTAEKAAVDLLYKTAFEKSQIKPE